MAEINPGVGSTDQAASQVQSLATQASAALNKLAQALQAAGSPKDVVSEVDNMANATNEIASAAVGNVPPEAEAPSPEVAAEPAPNDIAGAVQAFHDEQTAGQPSLPNY